ncbi:hypothetical protein NDU88_002261 [Pleurodeles waltl]|uniref:Uncharacterized protein n=1 Tax=Pleurodeles waltl TaxID=8319 RepID=A0AAV7VYU5_PLEWA|nr:hypothetical protein NDU88_002261 [Pleurodeles waltl]
MAYYAEEDDYFQDQPDTNDGHHLEERLVEALGYHVQDSVNQALINALKPFAQPRMRFGLHELRGRPLLDSGSQQDQPSEMGTARGASKRPTSIADILAHMAGSVIQDHGYGSYSTLEIPEAGLDSSTLNEGPPSSDSHSSNSDRDQEDPKPTDNRRENAAHRKFKMVRKTKVPDQCLGDEEYGYLKFLFCVMVLFKRITEVIPEFGSF